MNLQRIHYFLTFCESMHFTNAAKELSISQPALTKAIGMLEEEMGTRLVRREGKYTHLTQQGSSARRIFSAMMAHVNRAHEEIEEAFGDSGNRVRIAVVSSLSFTPLANFLVVYHNAHPNVRIDITDCDADESEDLLLNGKVDCLITAESDKVENRAECVELYNENMVIAGSAEEMEKSNNQHMIAAASNRFDGINSVSQNIYRVNNLEIESVVSCSQLLWAQQLVKNGVGFGLIPDSTDSIGGLGIFKIEAVIPTKIVCVAIPVGRKECSTMGRFIEMLKAYEWTQ